jgi:hypothetical protein
MVKSSSLKQKPNIPRIIQQNITNRNLTHNSTTNWNPQFQTLNQLKTNNETHVWEGKSTKYTTLSRCLRVETTEPSTSRLCWAPEAKPQFLISFSDDFRCFTMRRRLGLLGVGVETQVLVLSKTHTIAINPHNLQSLDSFHSSTYKCNSGVLVHNPSHIILI